MHVVAIVQARMGSSRLPGKVLADIGGCSMLARVVGRLRKAKRIDEIAVATTDLPEDEQIADASDGLGVSTFRGSERDVLDRYRQAARRFGADVVVRVTADCPLLDPALVDTAVAQVVDRGADCSCVVPIGPRAFPRGFDVEVCTVATLERAWQEATCPYERAHVTPFIYERPELFRLSPLEADRDYRHLRLTVDTPADLRVVRDLQRRLAAGNADYSWRDCVAVLEADPQLCFGNSHVRQKELLAG